MEATHTRQGPDAAVEGDRRVARSGAPPRRAGHHRGQRHGRDRQDPGALPPAPTRGYEPCWGEVTGVKPFGAFVLLPSGESGLLHVSELHPLNGGRRVDDATLSSTSASRCTSASRARTRRASSTSPWRARSEHDHPLAPVRPWRVHVQHRGSRRDPRRCSSSCPPSTVRPVMTRRLPVQARHGSRRRATTPRARRERGEAMTEVEQVALGLVVGEILAPERSCRSGSCGSRRRGLRSAPVTSVFDCGRNAPQARMTAPVALIHGQACRRLSWPHRFPRRRSKPERVLYSPDAGGHDGSVQCQPRACRDGARTSHSPAHRDPRCAVRA